MTTTITAAVANVLNGSFTFEQVELDDPRAGELLVRITSTGLCHTDLAVLAGDMPAPFPIVLGHEGAGVVEQVGSAVTGFEVGDRVGLSFASCGHCRNCLAGRAAYCEHFLMLNFAGVREDGSATMARTNATGETEPVHGSFFGQSSFGSYPLALEFGGRRMIHRPLQPGSKR